VIAAVLFSWLPAAACAEPVETTVGLTVNALTGQHQIGHNQVDRLTFAPLPLIEATVRSGSESLRLEGLPPLTLGYFAQNVGGASTRISILNATYRHALPGGWFAGIGETVYNQNTTFAQRNNLYYVRGSLFEQVNGQLTEFSRVAGLRLEAGQRVKLRNGSFEYYGAYNPRMHGITFSRVPTFFVTCTTVCTQQVDNFADPESATQVDVVARFAQHTSKHGELLYGLRYINFTARYDDIPGQLADRNVGFAPSLGYRLRF
jgi:hypothetical protein